MAGDFDPYYTWLGIPKSEQPPNHYRLLGLAVFETDEQVIAHAADRQMGYIRTFQTGPHSADSQTILNSLAAAKLCLLNGARRTVYDAELRAALEAAKPRPVEPTAAAPTISPRSGTHSTVLPPSLARPSVETPTTDLPPGPTKRDTPRRPPVWERSPPTSTNPRPSRSTAAMMPTLRESVTIQPPPQSEATAAGDPTDSYSLAEPIQRRPQADEQDDEDTTEGFRLRLPKVILAAVIFVSTAIGAAVLLTPSGDKDKPSGNNQKITKAGPKPGGSPSPQPGQIDKPAQAPGAGGILSPGANPQTAGTLAPFPNDGPLDVLAALRQSGAQFPGWHWDQGKLVSDPSLDTHLPLPFAVPQIQGQDSYLIEAVVERKAFDGPAEGCLVFGLPNSDGGADLILDLKGQRTGLGYFEGPHPTRISGAMMMGNLLPMGTPTTVVIRVLQKSIYVDCGGHQVNLDANSLRQTGLSQRVRAGNGIVISAKQSFALNKLEMRPFSANQSVPASQVAQREPPRLPDADTPNVNLLTLIIPPRDTFSGDWRFQAGQLVSTGFARQWRSIEIPFQPSGIYKIVLRCSVDSPQTAGVVMGLMNGPQQFTAGIDADHRMAGLTMISAGQPDPRVTRLVGNPVWQQDSELSLEYVVGAHPWFTCNNSPAGAAPFANCGLDPLSVRPAPDRLFLSCKGTRFTVRQLEYQRLTEMPPLPRGIQFNGFNRVAGANAAPNNPAVAGGQPVPIAPGLNLVTEDTLLAAGSTVDAERDGQWWKATVMDVLPDKSVRIQYVGLDSSRDEVVSRDRLRLPNGNVARNRVVPGVNFGNNFRPPAANRFAVPIIPSPILVANETPLRIFDEIEFQSGTNWWKGRITAVSSDGTVKVHSDGRPTDESVTRSHLRLPKAGRNADDPALAGASLDARPVPIDDAIADALDKVKDTYKEAYAAAKTNNDEKLKLSDRLLTEAGNQKDDAQAYAMFVEARQLALDSGHWQKALKSADEFDRRFQTGEPNRLQADVLLAASEKVDNEESIQELVDTAIAKIQEMLQGLTYSTSRDVALDFLKAANQAARSAKASEPFRKQIYAQTSLFRQKITHRFATAKASPPPTMHKSPKSHKSIKSR